MFIFIVQFGMLKISSKDSSHILKDHLEMLAANVAPKAAAEPLALAGVAGGWVERMAKSLQMLPQQQA